MILPELGISGYPPGDLLERASFLRDHTRALEELVTESRDIAILTGAILPAPEGGPKRISNSAVLLDRGEIAHVQAKTLLPTYDIFDESRYFQPAAERRVFAFRGRTIGIAICEDVWSGKFWGPRRPYPIDPVEELVAQGAEVIFAISASPWNQGKIALREAMVRDAARQHRVPFVFVNLVGGNDELDLRRHELLRRRRRARDDAARALRRGLRDRRSVRRERARGVAARERRRAARARARARHPRLPGQARHEAGGDRPLGRDRLRRHRAPRGARARPRERARRS